MSSDQYPGKGAPALSVPTNMALLIMTQGQDAQRHAPSSREAKESTSKTYNHIERFLSNCIVDDVWGNFGKPFEQAIPQREVNQKKMQRGGGLTDNLNDISSAAAFIHAVLVASTGSAIVGNVTESGFQSEEMRVKVDRNRNMPHTWKGIKLNHLGEQKLNQTVINDVPFDAI